MEEVKLSLFPDGMMLYMEHPKDSSRKLLELIDELDKAAGYKTNILKTNNCQEAFNRRLPVLDLSGVLCSLLIPEYSGIKRRGKPLLGLRDPGISFLTFSIW